MENFHETWKSGACNVETTQLRSVQNVIRWAIILASVAMRIQRLIYLSRSQPEQPATVEFTQPEIDAVIVVSPPTRIEPTFEEITGTPEPTCLVAVVALS